MSKELVVFYSHSGNTKKVANIISKFTGADVLELIPEESYPSDLWETVDIFKEDMKNNSRRVLKPINVDMSKYDTIYIGTPNWGNTVATPLLSFFDQYDLTDKKVLAFVTHGGGGLGKCANDIMKLSKSKMQQEALVFSGANVSEGQIKSWLKDVNSL